MPLCDTPSATAFPSPALPDAFARAHLSSLDGLRAIAVLLVIALHFGFAGVPGGSGVTIFFVLSGFLITWLLVAEQESTGAVDLWAFYRRRSLRIFPAFYGYWLLVVALLLVTRRPVPWGAAVSSALYLGDYYNALYDAPGSHFSHTWSLAIEEQFYLLWPVTFLWLRRAGDGAIPRLAAISAAAWAYRTCLVFGGLASVSWRYAAFDARFDALLVGCLLALLLRSRHAPAVLALASRWWHGCVTLALLALLHAGLRAGGVDYRDTMLHALAPPLIAILIVQAITHHAHPLWAWLDWAPLRALGRISYGVYLYQQLCLDPVKRLLDEWPVGVQFAGVLASTILIAAISYQWIERPFLRRKHRPQPS